MSFGSTTPFAEPMWYRTGNSPYYNDSHRAFRARVRKFIDEYVLPRVDDWEEAKMVPDEFYTEAVKAGAFAPAFSEKLGGTPPDGGEFDAFHDLIWLDEINRSGSGGLSSHFTIYTMAMPPILMVGSEYIQEKVVTPVLKGEKKIALCISEPYAGSDVASLRTTAERDGDFYIVNGQKKWITCSINADFFTVAVRTGGEGSGRNGISILLLEKSMPGIHLRRMDLMGQRCAGTCMVTFNDVRVPVQNLVGKENEGFRVLMQNFNHERFVIAVQANRFARECVRESIEYARKRETFGKRLVDHQVIRHKLADMSMRVESHWAQLEAIAFQMKNGTPSTMLGAECAMIKVLGSRLYELCAREACQIFGGSSFAAEGQGRMVERLYREVRGTAIPGGSEEVMIDLAMRQAKL